MATTFKRLGAVGVVADGGLRDIVEVRELGDFHYYGRRFGGGTWPADDSRCQRRGDY